MLNFLKRNKIQSCSEEIPQEHRKPVRNPLLLFSFIYNKELPSALNYLEQNYDGQAAGQLIIGLSALDSPCGKLIIALFLHEKFSPHLTDMQLKNVCQDCEAACIAALQHPGILMRFNDEEIETLKEMHGLVDKVATKYKPNR